MTQNKSNPALGGGDDDLLSAAELRASFGWTTVIFSVPLVLGVMVGAWAASWARRKSAGSLVSCDGVYSWDRVQAEQTEGVAANSDREAREAKAKVA